MKKVGILAVIIAALLVLFPRMSGAKVLGHGGSSLKIEGLKIENFRIEGESFKVGKTITAEFDLKNTGRSPVKLGKSGAFVACRDPYGVNRDFAHQYRNHTLRPSGKIHVKGQLKIDKKGIWSFWVGVSLLRGGWGPYGWGMIQLKASGASHGGNGSGHHSGGSGSSHHSGGSSSGHHSKGNSKIVLRPPYNNFTCWKTSPGDLVKGSRAICLCNQNTGYLGILDSAFAGGAASEPMIYALFQSPKAQKVKIRATFYYTGGTETIGYAAFAGLQAAYKYGSVYRKKDIVPGLDYKIAAQKIMDLALLAAPAVSKPKDVEEALEALDMVNNIRELSEALIDLYNARKAKKYVLTFTMNAKKGYNYVGIGLRGNCSALVTGSAFVVVAAQLNKIEVIPK